jgi:hypothetical protein
MLKLLIIEMKFNFNFHTGNLYNSDFIRYIKNREIKN